MLCGTVSVIFLNRCGYRGGYCEAINMDPDVFAMLMKSISAKLCPSVSGQVSLGRGQGGGEKVECVRER